MRLCRPMLLVGFGLSLAIAFCGLLTYLFITPWFDRPPASIVLSDQPSNSYCASRTCHVVSAYGYSGTQNDLLLFYQEKGFECKEVDSTSIEALLPEFKGRYWQCVGKATPRGDVVIGFQGLGTDIPATPIPVRVHLSWDPIL
jgi:hypothetical protein